MPASTPMIIGQRSRDSIKSNARGSGRMLGALRAVGWLGEALQSTEFLRPCTAELCSAPAQCGADIAFDVGDPWAQQNPWTIGCHVDNGRIHRKQCTRYPRY